MCAVTPSGQHRDRRSDTNRTSHSVQELYSLWFLGRLTRWLRPPSRSGFCRLWSRRCRLRTCRCNRDDINSVKLLSAKKTQYLPTFNTPHDKLLFWNLYWQILNSQLKLCRLLCRSSQTPPGWHCRQGKTNTHQVSELYLLQHERQSLYEHIHVERFYLSFKNWNKRTECQRFLSVDQSLKQNKTVPRFYEHFWALGLDWTSRTTVVTASAYMSFSGLAIHWGHKIQTSVTFKLDGENNVSCY